MTAAADEPDFVDLLFALEGSSLPQDHQFALAREIGRCLPWFDAEARAGIHFIRAARTDEGRLLLPRRAKLVLRLPESRVPEAMALAGRTLDVAGNALRVGTAKVRSLLPFDTLYAHFVSTGIDDELAFLDDVAAQVRRLETPCSCICGKRRVLRTGEGQLTGYSLMLHNLALEHSVVLQRAGIGEGRKLGCGVFVPHKAVAAVA